LAFQVSDTFIEVAVLRLSDEYKNSDDICDTEVIYSKKLPFNLEDNAKNYTILAEKLEELIRHVIKSEELMKYGFQFDNAKVVCVMNYPLSISVGTTYAMRLNKRVKITNRLLRMTISKGDVVFDGLADIPNDYAVYNSEVGMIKLNGYELNKPLGKFANDIELTIVKYLIKPDIWESTGAILERNFNRVLTYIHTEDTVNLDSVELCTKIYTGDELEMITRDIL
jgi:hypothetical protein